MSDDMLRLVEAQIREDRDLYPSPIVYCRRCRIAIDLDFHRVYRTLAGNSFCSPQCRREWRSA